MKKDNNEIAKETEVPDVDTEVQVDGDPDKAGEIKPKRKLNIVPKVVCLLFAVLIWYYVMQVDNPDYQQTISGIKVNLVNTDELNNRGLSIFTGTSYNADITVRGKKSVINQYTSDDISINADVLQNYPTTGEQSLELSVTLPSSLSLVDQGNTITVFIDEKTSVNVPVTAVRDGGKFSTDYEYGTIIPEFSEINVSGPKTIISNVDHAVVTADLSGITNVLDSTTILDGCAVTLCSADGDTISSKFLTNPHETMSVTYPVYLTKDVPLSVSYKYGLYNDSNVRIDIEPSTVEVKGDASFVKDIDSLEVAVIDEKQIDKDQTLTFDLKSNESYSFTDENISSVDVSITNVGTTTQIYRVNNLVVDAGNKDFELKNDYVDVMLRGTSAKLAAISADDITVKCDLSDYKDLPNGEYDAVIQISGNPSGVWEIGSYKLTISVDQ